MNASHGNVDYGPLARLGVAVPHSNPTVEPELRALLPPGIEAYATRLWHPAPRVEDRLNHYLRHLPDALRTFGVLPLRAFGVGCTGSSYTVGRALEDELTAAATARCGLPVITAAQAIRQALAALGVAHIALVSPYPEGLARQGYRYWRDAGIDLTGLLRVDPDTACPRHAGRRRHRRQWHRHADAAGPARVRPRGVAAGAVVEPVPGLGAVPRGAAGPGAGDAGGAARAAPA